LGQFGEVTTPCQLGFRAHCGGCRPVFNAAPVGGGHGTAAAIWLVLTIVVVRMLARIPRVRTS
jgi:hypothetical protein